MIRLISYFILISTALSSSAPFNALYTFNHTWLSVLWLYQHTSAYLFLSWEFWFICESCLKVFLILKCMTIILEKTFKPCALSYFFVMHKDSTHQLQKLHTCKLNILPFFHLPGEILNRSYERILISGGRGQRVQKPVSSINVKIQYTSWYLGHALFVPLPLFNC